MLAARSVELATNEMRAIQNVFMVSGVMASYDTNDVGYAVARRLGEEGVGGK